MRVFSPDINCKISYTPQIWKEGKIIWKHSQWKGNHGVEILMLTFIYHHLHPKILCGMKREKTKAKFISMSSINLEVYPNILYHLNLQISKKNRIEFSKTIFFVKWNKIYPVVEIFLKSTLKLTN